MKKASMLNSGLCMPLIGFGTAVFLFPSKEDSETIKLAILEAIKTGYRHFDTAALYQTEQCLGEAMAEALRLGLIASRDELFITSKLWCTHTYPDRVFPALQLSLNEFQVEGLVEIDFKSVWATMEECQRLGLTKFIGVSNFSCKKLEQILSTATIPPSVNQVFMKWAYEQGVSVVVKCFNNERMKENLKIFNWELTSEESMKIKQIPQSRGFVGEGIVSIDGPFKMAKLQNMGLHVQDSLGPYFNGII
ncbi:hypothetical protein Sjap_021455 [Stephania japonica]|uniref:NADP-dependent oxidoreductase domain-containing protein n=1 Tax=Stephania japonica TaxID=461633 RepID=A0AAP0ESM5_9MAGN